MDQHDIVLEIQDLGFEFSGTVSLMPVYTNNKDPELIFKSLSSTYETLPGTEVDKGANMKAGVYLKPGETQKVSFTYTPKYPGELMFVLYEAVTRKKGNPNVEGMINLIGFMLIFALMILITFKDIFKMIG
jgi:hypothetical protein